MVLMKGKARQKKSPLETSAQQSGVDGGYVGIGVQLELWMCGKRSVGQTERTSVAHVIGVESAGE